MGRRGMVVIVGRPNVGKSTLFNRLTGSRRALVHDQPGMTRDRIVGEARRPGGGIVTVVDTGGLVLGTPEAEDRWVHLIREQAEAAIDAADVALLVVDLSVGVIPEDEEIAAYLRSRGRPVVLVANKADHGGSEERMAELYGLGLGDPVPVSAEHGHGIAELWGALEPHLPPVGEEPEDTEGGGAGEIRIAIVGRPNVGKSSLLNLLAGESRALVSEVPGTTRDAVDVILTVGTRCYRFVDTAGIRRKGRTHRGPEVLSVVIARRQLERAHLALVVVDASDGVTAQDAHVAGYAWESGRGVVLVANKWDLVSGESAGEERLLRDVGRHLRFLKGVPLVRVSAKTGFGVEQLWPAIGRVHAAAVCRIGTAELNRTVRAAWEARPPSVPAGREAKLFYASQVGIMPPRFVLFTNLRGKVHFSYRRYLENELRQAFDLDGVPVAVMIRGRKR